jgi:hypothetical protein
MSPTAQLNVARNLREKAQRAAACGKYETAAVNWLGAGRLFSRAGSLLEAEQAWRKACDFCEREANRVATAGERSNLN